MTSIRAQLLAWLLALFTTVGFVGGLAAYLVALHEPDAFLDDQLRQVALNVGDTPGARTQSAPRIPDIDPEDEIVIEIWDADGKPVRLSRFRLGIPRHQATGFSVERAVGEDWRTYTLIGHDRTVQVSQRMSVRQELATNSALNTVLPLAVLVPLSWLMVGFVVRRVLQPLQELADGMGRRKTGSDLPLAVAGLPSEVTPLVDAMNDLLDRQHKLLEYRQRFISDAAHQLRTPLTALRLQAGNLGRAPLPPETQDLVRQMELGLKRISSTISQVLVLARAEAPDAAGNVQPNDLGTIVKEAMAAFLPLADERRIDLGMANAVDALIVCDRTEMRTLVDNLLDNAIRYTPAEGRVDVSIIAKAERIVLQVADTGPGIPDEARDRVFDRFFRHASAETEGTGLGLAIVKAIADRSNGEISLANRSDRSGLVARVSFPRRDS